ncbi:MAG TPA: carbohydrate-binding module family 20 domain-containing protein, partial [Chitinophagaceae bacterium]|nr:carbohydrate-binding module family 20 domain-containing protein [Chitinophagaceae bacterium]
MANLKETTSSKNKKLKISFWLRYKTNYGENIFITFLNNDYKLTQPIAMHYYDEVFWTTDLFLSINELNDENIYYQYHVINEDGIIKQEAFADKYFNLHIGKREINIIDYWNGTELAENIFFTKPFLQTLIPKTTIKTYSPKGKNYKHIFKVKAPLLHPNKTICLLGNVKELNNWNTQKPILLTKKEKEFYYSTFIKLPT